MNKSIIPWNETEAVLVQASLLDVIKSKLGFSYNFSYILKEDFKEASGLTDEEAEEAWSAMKEKGAVRHVYAKKYDGVIIDILDPLIES